MTTGSLERCIAKITSTQLGYGEDHGILTFWLMLDYGGSGQGFGGYALDGYNKATEKREGWTRGMDVLAGIINAAGVSKWEDLKGRTVYALREPGFNGAVRGIENLPTEKGCRFIFAEVADVK